MKGKRLTVQEAARKHNVSQQTVYNWLTKGLPYSTIRQGLKTIKVIYEEDIDKFINQKEG